MMRDTEASCKFVEEFQDKLMFGTDICSPNDDLPLSFWLDDVAEKGLISETAYKKYVVLMLSGFFVSIISLKTD